MKYQYICIFALAAFAAAVASNPAGAVGGNWDDGGGKKFFRDNCAAAIKQKAMPMSLLPMPWCMDASMRMTPFFMMAPHKSY